MSNYIDHLLKQDGNKNNTVASHLTNIYRGLEGVISSEFGRTPPKARLFLQEYHDNEYEPSVVRGLLADVLEDLNNLDGPTKVEIPSFAKAVIKIAKSEGFSLYWAMNVNNKSEEFRNWIELPTNQELFARAWNEGYIVKGTKYVVTDGNHLYFKGYQEDVDIVILADEQPGTIDYVKKFDTKEEAQKVADVLCWKVQEVE